MNDLLLNAVSTVANQWNIYEGAVHLPLAPTDAIMNAISRGLINLGIIFFAFSRSIDGFSTGDRVSTLIRTHHDGVSH